MKTLNIIGAGRLGRTLGALWQNGGVFRVQSIINRTTASARDAAAFIGAGLAADCLADAQAAGAWLIATPDAQLASVTGELGASGLARGGDIVFHCSGALAAAELRAALPPPVAVASVHPLKSFADPGDAVRSFAGTWCAAEGDEAALAVLLPAFEAIGARVTHLDARHKTLYHTASVMVCNDLTALMEAGLQCYEKAGLARDTASAMMEPLVRETLDNVFRLGTVKALTGPVARGDHAVVARQLAALRDFDPKLAAVYRTLGEVALQLSRRQGGADEAALAMLQRALRAAEGGDA
jgi:predicted short-subunit dehydrogenase-like oxidoreductase (DUF2520 family)